MQRLPCLIAMLIATASSGCQAVTRNGDVTIYRAWGIEVYIITAIGIGLLLLAGWLTGTFSELFYLLKPASAKSRRSGRKGGDAADDDIPLEAKVRLQMLTRREDLNESMQHQSKGWSAAAAAAVLLLLIVPSYATSFIEVHPDQVRIRNPSFLWFVPTVVEAHYSDIKGIGTETREETVWSRRGLRKTRIEYVQIAMKSGETSEFRMGGGPMFYNAVPDLRRRFREFSKEENIGAPRIAGDDFSDPTLDMAPGPPPITIDIPGEPVENIEDVKVGDRLIVVDPQLVLEFGFFHIADVVRITPPNITLKSEDRLTGGTTEAQISMLRVPPPLVPVPEIGRIKPGVQVQLNGSGKSGTVVEVYERDCVGQQRAKVQFSNEDDSQILPLFAIEVDAPPELPHQELATMAECEAAGEVNLESYLVNSEFRLQRARSVLGVEVKKVFKNRHALVSNRTDTAIFPKGETLITFEDLADGNAQQLKALEEAVRDSNPGDFVTESPQLHKGDEVLAMRKDAWRRASVVKIRPAGIVEIAWRSKLPFVPLKIRVPATELRFLRNDE